MSIIFVIFSIVVGAMVLLGAAIPWYIMVGVFVLTAVAIYEDSKDTDEGFDAADD